jgi:hypothetical protein
MRIELLQVKMLIVLKHVYEYVISNSTTILFFIIYSTIIPLSPSTSPHQLLFFALTFL